MISGKSAKPRSGNSGEDNSHARRQAAARPDIDSTVSQPHQGSAPGSPGNAFHWASARKDGVGAALNAASAVSFTICQGVLSEVYFPSVDSACMRDLQLLITHPTNFFSEERRDTHSELSYAAPGVPAYRLVNTCNRNRYRLEKEIVADPHRAVVLQRVRFVPLQGNREEYRVYVLLNPRLANQGNDNTAWVGQYKSIRMLCARRGSTALALACTAHWKQCSAGFVGVSDGWQDVREHYELTAAYERAENGNVALIGEIDLEECAGKFVLALGFGRDHVEAGHRSRCSLLQGFETVREEYVNHWTQWQRELLPLEGSRQHPEDIYRISAMVMRIHEAKDFPGAIVASLAIPWGESHGADDKGYHLVWPRDMIETVGGLLAVRKHVDARRVLLYLQATQEADGHWPQNMFLDGQPCWNGVQLDETAFVILLVALARREGAVTGDDINFFWPMVRCAAGFLVRHGPVTPMDRWEEVPGYFASTFAVEIPALLVAADIARSEGEESLARYLEETADIWNETIDRTLYVQDSPLARQAGVDDFYVRFAAPTQPTAPSPADGMVHIVNHPPGEDKKPAAEIASPDALTLVRFGLRAADDQRMINTAKVIDMTCKVQTPHGDCWHRYNFDGYGEHANGDPFDGTGIGRGWPLLTGERAHFELAAGRRDEAERLLRAMESLASDSGLLSEQVWDTADIPEKDLHKGRPSGSAMHWCGRIPNM